MSIRRSSTHRQRDVLKALRALIPQARLSDLEPIREKALAGHLRHLPPSIAAWQALTSYVRHVHTDYDAMLDEGYDQVSARHFVVDDMNDILSEWGCPRQVSIEGE